MTLREIKERAEDRRMAIYHRLVEAAENSEPCPSNNELAKVVGLSPTSNKVTRFIETLEERGLIRRHGLNVRRTIVIVETGKSAGERPVPLLCLKKTPVREIVRHAAEIWDCPSWQIYGPSQKGFVTRPRQAVYRVGIECGHPANFIGDKLARGHSAVIHGAQVIEEWAKRYRDVARKLDELRERCFDPEAVL